MIKKVKDKPDKGTAGGQTRSARLLAEDVRELALKRAKELLLAGRPVKKRGHKETAEQKEDREEAQRLYDSTYEKVLGASIPRLQEVSGPNGGPVQHELSSKEKDKLTAILHGKEIEPEGDGSDDEGDAS